MQNTCKYLAYLALIAPLTALAECPENKTLACDFAKTMATDLSRQLPVQMGQNMQLNKVFAQDQHLNFYILLSYDRAFLASTMRQRGASIEDARRGLNEFAKNYVCSTPMLIQATKVGLVQSFHYQLVNGELLTSFSVSKCN